MKNTLYIFKEIDQMEGYALQKKMFTISNINSPYKRRSKKKKAPQIYTVEEFMEFLNIFLI